MRWLSRIVVAIHRRPGLVLAIYWPIAFIGTHLPRYGPLRGEPRRYPIDKLAHFACYALLAWLIMLLLSRRLGTAAAAGLTLLIVAAYGALDELTQPFIGRTNDVWDYAADLAGAAVGILVARTWSRHAAAAPIEPRVVATRKAEPPQSTKRNPC